MRIIRRIALGMFLILTVSILLTVSFSPNVPARSAPTAEQVRNGKMAAMQLRDLRAATATGPTQVRFDNDALDGMMALAANALKMDRINATVKDGLFTGEMSIPFPLGAWINVRADIAGESRGFPALRLKIGRLPLPPSVSRPFAELIRQILRLRGADVPPLDSVVRKTAVKKDVLEAELPPSRGDTLLRQFAGLKTGPVSGKTVAKIYCALTQAQKRQPESNFTVQLRRAFTVAQYAGTEPPEQINRAAFVALAMFVVDERAGELAGGAVKESASCRQPAPLLLLEGRSDLPQHWSLSAAMGAMLGNDISKAMGEWKELSDSLPSGSGFSFADLAADRSGLRMARLASDPDQAVRIRTALQTASSAQILPPEVLALEEGLSEKAFTDHYQTIETRKYQAALARIDAMLDRVGIR
ncbi:hypothetical protein [Sphingobium boeckii]|uniref:Uncharacterized protein n=1 Tax=Sphingobium boeckii TaxID=1082345 RepID=A0A7W9AK25_9SPHN|nr:hypothetical protein [Sphingobium boeckii]MBB5687115.1 hypothetical protein [Sphingobium boeckii]